LSGEAIIDDEADFGDESTKPGDGKDDTPLPAPLPPAEDTDPARQVPPAGGGRLIRAGSQPRAATTRADNSDLNQLKAERDLFKKDVSDARRKEREAQRAVLKKEEDLEELADDAQEHVKSKAQSDLAEARRLHQQLKDQREAAETLLDVTVGRIAKIEKDAEEAQKKK
jgi:hypothetical protein